MDRLVVDSSTGSKLRTADGPLQVFDEGGEVLGYFTPVATKALYTDVQPPSREEELLRRAEKGGGRTLAQIMDDLSKRP